MLSLEAIKSALVSSVVNDFASKESQTMRFPIIQRLIDWFRKLSVPPIILALLFILLVMCAVWLYPRTSCAISGGEWAVSGLANNAFCLRTYPDAGKPCRRSDECMGGCVLYEVIVGQPTPSVGVCKINNDAFECFAVIEYPHLYTCAD